MDLSGRVVVVPVEWAGTRALAGALGGAGATVVLVGPDGEAAGRLAATLEAGGGGRPAVFVTAGSDDGMGALAAFVAELFRAP